MSRTRMFRTLGALVASAALVLSGSLTAHAAGNSFSVTVRLVDAGTGKLIGGKIQYRDHAKQDDVVVANGATVTLKLEEDENFAQFAEFYFPFDSETYAQYVGSPCVVSSGEANSVVTCEYHRYKFSTVLDVVDEKGKSLTLDIDDVVGYGTGLSRVDKKTVYLWDEGELIGIEKPGYHRVDVSPVVGGTTKVALKKAPTREVTVKFVDAVSGKGLPAMAGIAQIRGNEEYSVSYGQKLTLPVYHEDYYGADNTHDGFFAIFFPANRYGWSDYYGGECDAKKSVCTVEVPSVHVKVVDEDGNPVSGARVEIRDQDFDAGAYLEGHGIEHVTEPVYYGYPAASVSSLVTGGSGEVSRAQPSHSWGGCEGGCVVGDTLVSITVQAPAGYENPKPVNPFVYTEDWVVDGLDKLDSRVQRVTRERAETYGDGETVTYRDILGEIVTITLKKKPASSASPSASPSASTSPKPSVTPSSSSSPKPSSNPSVKPSASVSPSPSVSPSSGGDVCVSGESRVMYRLYNRISQEHLYTADENERDVLSKGDWTYEGIAWVSPVKSETPVYRLYNPILGDHHYTTDKNERDTLVAYHNWVFEGIGWYSDDCKNVPVYRQFTELLRVGSHNYTADKNEYDTLNATGVWKAEGEAWYAIKWR